MGKEGMELYGRYGVIRYIDTVYRIYIDTVYIDTVYRYGIRYIDTVYRRYGVIRYGVKSVRSHQEPSGASGASGAAGTIPTDNRSALSGPPGADWTFPRLFWCGNETCTAK